MSTTWNTKYGPRRVRHDPPTVEEAIVAARDLTDDVDQQVEIAAGLMEVAADEVRAALKKVPPVRKSAATVAFTSRGGTERSVVVERKPSRRVIRPIG
jgi:hypothetical protein